MATPFVMLGTIGYAKLTSPTSMDLTQGWTYAEHQVVEGKPLLQFMGANLDGFSMTFLFHASFCIPQKSYDALVALANAHTAFPLIQGNGRYLGRFVITELSRTAQMAAGDGTLLSIEVKATLKEYVDKKPLETKTKVAKAKAPARKKAGKRKAKVKKADVPQLTAASRAAGYTLVNKKTVVRQKA
ncbi:MAG: phage tail protein [Trichlorobacter sp.]|uniref:phage tail protein n=1 Tax=Trichlorobacter sp. TaxID=2911007 RepID=UPI00256CB445|nr:phage tail protein [Trichlorobacter sp.]MDK9716745.1 phage tail protein [Trichlorobacter sp.]